MTKEQDISMNRWIRIVFVSVLALMMLEPAAIAAVPENARVSGLYGTFQCADLPNVTGNQVSPIPAAIGGNTGNSDTTTKNTLTVASGPSISGVSIFPGDHIWNTRVDSLPVDSRSADYVSTIGSTAYLHADFGSGLYEGNPMGIPYTIVNASQQKTTVLFEYADESDTGPYPIPDNPFIEGGSDHHMLIIERDTKILYELYAAEKQPDGSWTAGSGAVFNLSGYALRPSGWTSADAAGLAILPGLVRYDEVNTGEINHALRFTAPSSRRAYIWPARHYASSLTSPAYPPMGQRFRLKSSFNTSGYSSQAQIVLNALKKYGMILSDNGAPWYITGVPDERWNNDVLHTLHQITGSDFEAVDSSSLMMNQDSGKALIMPIVTTPPQRIGVFRPSNHIFYLNNGTAPTAINWGTSTDLPVTGDWNGDGRTDIGIYRPSAHTFYLKNGTTAAINWGTSTDLPVTGDWNGDRITDVGVYRPSTHTFYLKNGTTTAINWGTSTDLPVTGRW